MKLTLTLALGELSQLLSLQLLSLKKNKQKRLDKQNKKMI